MLRDPARVAVTPVASTVERITQRIIQVDHSAKPAVLAQLLKQEPVDRALIFTRTKHGADKVVKGLERAGITADAIHGNKSQNHRERVLAAFRTGEIRTLVATDIAARGIDVDGISSCGEFRSSQHTRDLCPPHRPHRARRRRRRRDLALAGEEMAYLRDIEKLIRISLPREDRRTPGHRDAAPAPSQHRGARSATARARCQGPMKPRLARKGLAVTAVLVVIMALRKPTGTRPRGMSRYVRRRRKAAARLKGCRASPFCIAKAVRIPDPTAPNDHASRRSIWR